LSPNEGVVREGHAGKGVVGMSLLGIIFVIAGELVEPGLIVLAVAISINVGQPRFIVAAT